MQIKLPDNERPSWWRDGDPLVYTATPGKHEYAYDLVTDDLPEELVERIYECVADKCYQWHLECFGKDIALKMSETWLEYPLGLRLSVVEEWRIDKTP